MRSFLVLVFAALATLAVPSVADAGFSGCTGSLKTQSAAVYCASHNPNTPYTSQYRARTQCRNTSTGAFAYHGYGSWVSPGSWSVGYCGSGTYAASVTRLER